MRVLRERCISKTKKARHWPGPFQLKRGDATCSSRLPASRKINSINAGAVPENFVPIAGRIARIAGTKAMQPDCVVRAEARPARVYNHHRRGHTAAIPGKSGGAA